MKVHSPPGQLCGPESSNMLQGYLPAQGLAIEGIVFLAMDLQGGFLQKSGLTETQGWGVSGKMTTEVQVEGIVRPDVTSAIVETRSLGVGKSSV